MLLFRRQRVMRVAWGGVRGKKTFEAPEELPIRAVDGTASLAGSVPFHRRHAMLVMPFPPAGMWPRSLEVWREGQFE
jgi:hypothetical protein